MAASNREYEISYAVNIEHPDIQNLFKKLDTPLNRDFEDVLKIIEAGVPVEQICSDGGLTDDTVNQELTPDYIIELSEKMINRFQKDGMAKEQIIKILAQIEPYALYINKIKSIIDGVMEQ